MAGGSAGGAAGGSAGGTADAGCVPAGGTDLPDDLGLDTNCDGIDGDATLAVFVDATSGLDTNPGTRAAPFQTITRALDADRPQILVSAGTYAEALGLGTGNFGIHGGYNAGSSWVRTATRPVLTQPIMVRGDGGTLALDFLRVATAASSTSRAAAYAFIADDVSGGVTISRCEFVAGRGGDGAVGAPGTPGLVGGDGLPGFSGDDGGAPGAGGVSACGVSGSRGGRGGTSASLDGETLSGGAVGGTGATCLTLPCAAATGGTGARGLDGGAGATGLDGTPAGLINNRRWAPIDGRDGGAGLPGQPGQPAGGGGAADDVDAGVVARGGGAGGTGAGGCGGLGGTGGQSGGASISVLLVNASPTFDRCLFATQGGGNGGNGGSGGLGGHGGFGGPGGTGEVLGQLSGGDGGLGGTGGSGGPGGVGGRGAGGPSVGLWCEGASSPSVMAPTFALQPAGSGAGTNLTSQRFGTCP
jgi:hypothetical protein